ncbi:hypothetical protein [Nocardia phage P3.1]|nr:hypothetical protein [Nocardia phage P3.1]
MLLYEKREDYVELSIVERKGHRSAFFPWQREPHIVALFAIAGKPMNTFRFHVKNDFDLDQIFVMFKAMVEDMRK